MRHSIIETDSGTPCHCGTEVTIQAHQNIVTVIHGMHAWTFPLPFDWADVLAANPGRTLFGNEGGWVATMAGGLVHEWLINEANARLKGLDS